MMSKMIAQPLLQFDVAEEYKKTALGFDVLAKKSDAANQQKDYLKYLRLHHEYYYLYLSHNNESAKNMLLFADRVAGTARHVQALSPRASIYYYQLALTVYQSMVANPYALVRQLRRLMIAKIVNILQQLIVLFQHQDARKTQHYRAQYKLYCQQAKPRLAA